MYSLDAGIGIGKYESKRKKKKDNTEYYDMQVSFHKYQFVKLVLWDNKVVYYYHMETLISWATY